MSDLRKDPVNVDRALLVGLGLFVIGLLGWFRRMPPEHIALALASFVLGAVIGHLMNRVRR